ncbi:hypothetical protein [Hyphomicrobium sp. ghe19]|uniref:hypothetical protein n=1 Tax=Hyphomicrobium sp. ghe19 TaxID=2682968 RepID=UPI0030D3A519
MREEAAEIIRGLIASILPYPEADAAGKRALTIDLKGHLAGILRLAAAGKNAKGINCPTPTDQQVMLVAGARNSCNHYTPDDASSFRYQLSF